MIEWIGDLEHSTLKINNHIIGGLTRYNDCDEDFGWYFVWDYGVMKYDFDSEFFSVSDTEMLWSEFDNVKKKVLCYVKDIMGKQYLEHKHIYESI